MSTFLLDLSHISATDDQRHQHISHIIRSDIMQSQEAASIGNHSNDLYTPPTMRSDTGPLTWHGGCSFHRSSGSWREAAAPNAGEYLNIATRPLLVPADSTPGDNRERGGTLIIYSHR